jgi:hypothetical protein
MKLINQLGYLNPLLLRRYTNQKCVTMFLLLQFANCKPWYTVIIPNVPFYNVIGCAQIVFAPPSDGDSGPFTSHIYLNR